MVGVMESYREISVYFANQVFYSIAANRYDYAVWFITFFTNECGQNK